MRKEEWCRSFVMFALAVVCGLGFASPVLAQDPPDVCGEIDACSPPTSICDAGGFLVSFESFTPANDPGNFTGANIYTYKICSPPAGTCSGNAARSCLSDGDCSKHDEGDCSRQCAVDEFRGLSHFNIDFPSLGDTCLSETNFVGGTCSCDPGSSGDCSVDANVVLGDGSCDNDGSVAKCDNTTLGVGDCITMSLQVAGEGNELGLGVATVVSKESGDCNESCIAGPWCAPPEICDDEVDNDCDGAVDCADTDCDAFPGCGGDGGGECLTRTLGFWGTHPWITNNYTPVTVCGYSVGCSGAADGESNPSCQAHTCNSVMEALGSVGGEIRNGGAYIALIKQLAAAKLNLAATGAIVEDADCSDWEYNGKTIQAWIEACEAPSLCAGSQSQVSSSGCIEALDAFNNSADTGFPQPPAPFDQPPVDDFGNISGADPSNFTAAHGGGYVIGKNVPGGANCK